MATEKLLPNGDDGGWTGGGAFGDIDEGIASADAAVLAAGADNEDVEIDLDPSGVEDADTVTEITVTIRARTTSAQADRLLVDLLIGGTPQGTQQVGAALGAGFASETFTDVGWDVDRTAAEMDGAQWRIRADQTGMPGAVGHEIDAMDTDIAYDPPPADEPFIEFHSQVRAQQNPLLRI